MILRNATLAVIALALLVAAATAERPVQKRDKADLVVSGKVEKIATKTAKFGNDGEMTNYVVTVKVDKVETGKDVKAGDSIEVRWFHVTKRPSKPLPGAYGQAHDLKEKDEAKFWLMKAKDGWTVIYNKDGVEKK
jgi:hypothetical protein